MKISAEEDVVFKDFDDLEKVLKEANLPELANSIYVISGTYFLGKGPKDVFKSYMKNRKRLVKLLRKDEWKTKDTVDALKTGVKMYSARDCLDAMQETKERELASHLDRIPYTYPQLLDISRRRLSRMLNRLEHNPSYISRVVSKVQRKSYESEYSEIEILNCLKAVLFHPKGRYVSHAAMLNINENLNANKVVKIIGNCRKRVLKNLRMLAPRDFYEDVERKYEEQAKLIKLTDKQERFEVGKMNDRIVLDSLLKNLCQHDPPHYEGLKTPKEFLYGLLGCPSVQELFSNLSKETEKLSGNLYQVASSNYVSSSHIGVKP